MPEFHFQLVPRTQRLIYFAGIRQLQDLVIKKRKKEQLQNTWLPKTPTSVGVAVIFDE